MIGKFFVVRMTIAPNYYILFAIRCRFVEIDAQDALEIDDLQQLELANVMARLYEWKTKSSDSDYNRK